MTPTAERQATLIREWHAVLLALIHAVENEHGGFAEKEREALGMLVHLAVLSR